MDAEPGLQLFSVGILWDAAIVSFDAEASTSPDIILPSANAGLGEADRLLRARDPWKQWPGDRPPGFDQVNIDYHTPLHLQYGILPAAASGTGISLGSLVFHVDSLGDPRLTVAFTSSNVIFANNVVIDPEGKVIPTIAGIVDLAEVSIIQVPEPRTSLLALAGLMAAIRLGRRPGRGLDPGRPVSSRWNRQRRSSP